MRAEDASHDQKCASGSLNKCFSMFYRSIMTKNRWVGGLSSFFLHDSGVGHDTVNKLWIDSIGISYMLFDHID